MANTWTTDGTAPPGLSSQFGWQTTGTPPPIGSQYGTTDPPVVPPPETPYVPTPGQFAILRTLLTRYGLLDLYDTAVGWMIDGTADSPERLELALRDTQQFRTRFKGMFDREANGLPPISVDEYLGYEDQAYQLMRAYDFPPGFYDDTDDFANLIGHNVSTVELEQRLAQYAETASLGRETVRQELARHAGQFGAEMDIDALSDGDLAAFFADPERGLQAIRGRVQSAKISAQARNAGFGALSASEADRLQGVGLDEGGAGQAFGALVQQREVTTALAGESPGMDRDRVLAAAGGDALAVGELEQRAAGRAGQFRRGGSYAGGNQGLGV